MYSLHAAIICRRPVVWRASAARASYVRAMLLGRPASVLLLLHCSSLRIRVTAPRPLVFGHLKLRVPLQLSAGQRVLLLGCTSSVMLLLHCASLRIRVTPKLSLL